MQESKIEQNEGEVDKDSPEGVIQEFKDLLKVVRVHDGDNNIETVQNRVKLVQIRVELVHDESHGNEDDDEQR